MSRQNRLNFRCLNFSEKSADSACAFLFYQRRRLKHLRLFQAGVCFLDFARIDVEFLVGVVTLQFVRKLIYDYCTIPIAIKQGENEFWYALRKYMRYFHLF